VGFPRAAAVELGDFREADFSGASLSGTAFDTTQLNDTHFTDGTLQNAKFKTALLWNADFTGAELTTAEFSKAELGWATFRDAELEEAEFHRANLLAAEFTNANLKLSEFHDADLPSTILTGTDCRGADFSDAALQDAVFTRADCRDAVFTGAFLYETVFADTRINSATTFYDPESTYYDSIIARPACVYEENSLIDDGPANNTPRLRAARWVYRRLETLHEENAMSEAASRFHISKEEAERKLHRERGEWKGWLIKETMGRLTRHGESVQRTITAWLLVILVFGLVYPFAGGIKDSGGTRYQISSLSELATFEGWNDLLLNVYFSGITFSTIGYGDLSPAAPGTRALVFVESLLSAVLVALLVFVLGRRVAR
jgi:hypothetical protein